MLRPLPKHVTAMLIGAMLLGAVGALVARHFYGWPIVRDEDSCPTERAGPADVIMLGDSLVEGYCWKADHPELVVLNRGRAANTTTDVYNRLDELLVRHPKVIVLLGGTNDIDRGWTVREIGTEYRKVVAKLAPVAHLVLVTVPPCSHPNCSAEEKARIVPLNREIARIAHANDARLIDLYGAIATPEGEMPHAFSFDGLHLNEAGYARWNELLEPVWPSAPSER
jgi:lysophospholipase L1-like esterase